MGITNSISHFTASLAGSLFGSLEQVRCDTRPVEKRPETDEEGQKRQSENSAESGDRTRGSNAGGLVPTPWLAADDRVQPDSGLEDHEERQGRDDGEERRDETRETLEANEASAKRSSSGSETGQAKLPGEELSDAEKEMIQELKQRDAEVRAHEQAHVAAAAGHTRGGPTYEYQTGPDGRQYAVGGSVALDISPVPGDPKATIEKAKAVRRSALAPAQPSSQDRTVAASASSMESQARTELADEENGQASATESEDDGQARGVDSSSTLSQAISMSGDFGEIAETDVQPEPGESGSSTPAATAEAEPTNIRDNASEEDQPAKAGSSVSGRLAAQAYEHAMRFDDEASPSLSVAA